LNYCFRTKRQRERRTSEEEDKRKADEEGKKNVILAFHGVAAGAACRIVVVQPEA
jgi:hypothetical protein